MANFTPLRPLLRAANSSPASILTRSAQRSSPFSTSPANKYARLTVVGNLGADPELITTQSGKELLKYNVATTQFRNRSRETSWFRIAHFLPAEGPSRDYALGLQKGTTVIVDGDASIRVTEEADGKRRHELNVVQRNIEVLKRPFKGSDDEGAAE